MSDVPLLLAVYQALVDRALKGPVTWDSPEHVPGPIDGIAACTGKVEDISIVLVGTGDAREGTISRDGFVARLTPGDLRKLWALASRSANPQPVTND